MQKAVLFVSLLAVASAFPNQFSPSQNSSGGRIVGGQDADIKDFPYQVSLRSQGRHFCGGSIYLANIIITATHCFYGYDRIQLTVESGTSSRTLPGLSSKVKRVVLHPNFSRETMDYDIAILLLETEIPFGPTIQPIFLAPANRKTIVGSKAIKSEGGLSTAVKEIVLHPYFDDEIMDYDVAILLLEEGIPFDDTRQPIALPAANSKTVDGSRAYVSGWGATLEGGSSPDQLQYVAVMTMDRQKCAEAYQKVDYPWIVSGNRETFIYIPTYCYETTELMQPMIAVGVHACSRKVPKKTPWNRKRSAGGETRTEN
ncbi:unnamed protein product [Hermetia illucens]|uniref:Peptidase S1 domain-containing protein n=1 Tax=Hermetia illucens TaxID=343691 RepID=A0A7R8YUR8_HERIL|nr:unnamed protein product [Hermetia illucens]